MAKKKKSMTTTKTNNSADNTDTNKNNNNNNDCQSDNIKNDNNDNHDNNSTNDNNELNNKIMNTDEYGIIDRITGNHIEHLIDHEQWDDVYIEFTDNPEQAKRVVDITSHRIT